MIYKKISTPNLLSISFKSSILLSLGLLFAGVAGAAADFQSPRVASLGGAGHAGPLLNDATYLNPSYIGLLPTYGISFHYLGYSAGENSGHYGRNLNAAIQDGRTEVFQAGAGYTILERGRFLNLALAKRIKPNFSVGIGWKLFFETSNLTNANDGVISATYIPVPWLQLAVVVDNILETDKGKSVNLYREVIIAAKVYVKNILMLYLDPHFAKNLPTEDTFGYEGGAELTIFKDLFFRGGLYKNSLVPYQGQRGKGFGLGIGWVGPRITLDYAFHRITESEGSLPPSSAHTIGFTIFF